MAAAAFSAIKASTCSERVISLWRLERSEATAMTATQQPTPLAYSHKYCHETLACRRCA